MVRVYTKSFGDETETCHEYPNAVDYYINENSGYLHILDIEMTEDTINPVTSFSHSSNWTRVKKGE